MMLTRRLRHEYPTKQKQPDETRNRIGANWMGPARRSQKGGRELKGQKKLWAFGEDQKHNPKKNHLLPSINKKKNEKWGEEKHKEGKGFKRNQALEKKRTQRVEEEWLEIKWDACGNHG